MNARTIRKTIGFLGCIFLLFLLLTEIADYTDTALASQKVHKPLIQTTTFKEEYEGMLQFGGTYTDILEYENIDKAYENVKGSIVKITAGAYYGSGVIWEMNEQEIIIISNRHLLANGENSTYAEFAGGLKVPAAIVMLSDTYDLGFVKVLVSEIPYNEIINLREVGKDAKPYHNLKAKDAVFTLGMSEDVNLLLYEGTVAAPWWYIEEFESYMLYGFCYAKPGMSGGGTFDGFGNFAGMLTGGTGADETVSLPITVISEEYNKLNQQRDTGDVSL